MKRDSVFWAICGMDDDLILEAEEGISVGKKQGKRAVRIAMAVAGIAAVLAGTALAVRLYTKSADRMEENWNQQAQQPMTSEQKDFIEEKSSDVGKTVTDQGITVTVESVTCTDEMVYAAVRLYADPQQYSGDEIALFPMVDAATAENIQWEAPVQGEVVSVTGDNRQADGSIEAEWRIRFAELPEGQRLSGGETTMNLEIAEFGVHLMVDGEMQEQTVAGDWKISVVLPESDTSVVISAQENAVFEGELNFSVEQIQVTADDLRFELIAPSDDYVIVGTDQLELAKAAEPDAPFYSVEARLEDGTCVPTTGASMSLNEESGMDEWNIRWMAPIDPATVVSLVFTDGTAEQEIPLEK